MTLTRGDRVRVSTDDHYDGMPGTVVGFVHKHGTVMVVVQMYGTVGESGQFHYSPEQVTPDERDNGTR